MMTLASYLNASKISQADFAASVGVQQPTVHRWLHGARPSWDKAALIERVTDGAVPIAAWAHIHSPSFEPQKTDSLPSKDVGSGNANVKGAA
jgi:DNA-binding transcriptional regulator YdaS (Cro superfamily)